MGYRGTTTEQSSDQPEGEPYQLRLDHIPLIMGIVCLTVAVLLAILDNVAKADYIRGMYSILTGLFVVGIVGWQVRSGQARVRRMVECHARAVDDQLAELTSVVAELTSVVERLSDEVFGQGGQTQRMTYLPSPRVHQCTRYVGAVAVGGQDDTVPTMPTIAPETDAALRRLNMKLLNGGADS